MRDCHKDRIEVVEWMSESFQTNLLNFEEPNLSCGELCVLNKGREIKAKVGGGTTRLLSLQETPLGCSSRMPGNLMFLWFSKWIKSGDLQDLTPSRHAWNSIRDKASNCHWSEVDNMVWRWRTYHAGRSIHKTDIYKWLIMTRKALIIQITSICH